MMHLDEHQQDALRELFNVGMHRAAASLSELTRQRIIVDLPKVWVVPIDQIQQQLAAMVEGDLATVHQIFAGPVAGDAVLLLEYEKAALLTRLMTDGQVAGAGRLDQSAREVLAEVGNVVLGACLSAFGDMLKVGVSFSVPRLHVESLTGVLRSLHVDSTELRYAVIAGTRFQLSELEVDGFLIVAVGVTSLTRIMTALARQARASG
jgi:chemotaxis protein CheC